VKKRKRKKKKKEKKEDSREYAAFSLRRTISPHCITTNDETRSIIWVFIFQE
jgi:hypothetical protein